MKNILSLKFIEKIQESILSNRIIKELRNIFIYIFFYFFISNNIYIYIYKEINIYKTYNFLSLKNQV